MVLNNKFEDDDLEYYQKESDINKNNDNSSIINHNSIINIDIDKEDHSPEICDKKENPTFGSIFDRSSPLFIDKVYLVWPMWVTHFFTGFSNNITPIMFAVAADVTSKEERSKYLALVGITMGLSLAISPLIGVALISWHVISVVIVAFCTNVVGLFTIVFMKETIHYSDSIPITKEQRQEMSGATKKSKNPFKAIYYLFKSSLYIGFYAIIFFLFSFTVQDSQNTAFLYSNVRYGWGPTQAGIITSTFGIGVMVFSGICNGLLKYVSDRVLSIVSKASPSDMQGFILSAVNSLCSVASFVGALTSENIFAYFISSKAPFYFPGMHFCINAGIILVTFLFSLYVMKRFPVGCPDENCSQEILSNVDVSKVEDSDTDPLLPKDID
ncbi:hypothetical protein PPL_00422 [Heterostelium album PN500]|uniref:Uncharacterized protein n=1 Tax=Heterostelium pallidum (strain ATCC 26659 / Pp 5 / PN500) TaxID=670386 RepID=D3AWE8_HETP5|nr:hypothetical protein PPL_00422 [Heterostelium album PN500]EFA86621.1 hypothetical protein PPL_00422 [Heterostelium album PN500]|eukprot:XP_020438726.1 hypothetical protein PPL_00422 [Heterostelium album PN500]